MTCGASTVSTAKVRKPRLKHLLDGIPPDTRVVIMDVTWDVYESFVDGISEGENCRVAFDGKDIEMMSIGPFHDLLKSRIDAFIAVVAGELAIEREAVGSTTWKRKNVKRGIESDLSYYFDLEKIAACALAASRESNEVTDYPNPDLAIEIDLSPSKIDRPGIYAALKVPELWRVRKGLVSIEHLLSPTGYVGVEKSAFLPVRPHDVTRWIFSEDSRSRVAWERRLREWVRNEFGRPVNG
jgi:Uma2 family endonuclease